MEQEDRFKDIDALLGGLVKKPTLKELFEAKLDELQMAETAAREVLGTNYRSLKRILAGTETMVDFTLLFKLSDFLQIEREEAIKLYTDSLERNLPQPPISAQKIKFIKENFQLAVLKKAGFIKSISDFVHIEKRITARLGLKSILEYRRPTIDVAFSSGFFKPENHLNRAFWIQASIAMLKQIDNPNEYSRERLVKFFPRIRWYSINEERGLVEVIKHLYEIGVTVVFQPPLPTLQLRGATFIVNDKPCIVLTNYMGLYPTLWFALIHELYHVLFDLEEIKESRYHLTDDSNDQLSVIDRERMADEFACEYLCSRAKLEYLSSHFSNADYVYNFALNNHVHPSIIYAIKAYETPKPKRKSAWKRIRNYYNKNNLNSLINSVAIEWTDEREIAEVLREKLAGIYNH